MLDAIKRCQRHPRRILGQASRILTPEFRASGHIDGDALLEDIEWIAGERVEDVACCARSASIPQPTQLLKASRGSSSGAWFHGCKIVVISRSPHRSLCCRPRSP